MFIMKQMISELIKINAGIFNDYDKFSMDLIKITDKKACQNIDEPLQVLHKTGLDSFADVLEN